MSLRRMLWKRSKNMSKFIVFEGLDGSGKTTQLRLLAEWFNERGIPHKITKEPTDNPIGRLARSVVRGTESLSEEALSLLFSADRAEHSIKEIKPALEEGIYVLCDRYIYSNIAYQNIPIDGNSIFLIPDLTVFIDTNPEECTLRIKISRPVPEKYDGLDNAINIRNGYLSAFKKYSNVMPVEIINGNPQINDVFAEILKLRMINEING